MANLKSSKKDIRRITKRRARNLSAKTALKTYVKKARKAGESGQETAVTAAASAVQKFFDKAAQKGILHPNQAARRKSRAMKAAHKALAAKAV